MTAGKQTSTAERERAVTRNPLAKSSRRALLSGFGAASLALTGCAPNAPVKGARTVAHEQENGSLDAIGFGRGAYEQFATGLLFTHNALRRNLTKLVDVAKNGRDTSHGFLRFLDLFSRFLTGHHEGEDRFIFPALRDGSMHRSTDVAFLDQKGVEHRALHQMLEHLGRINAALQRSSMPAFSELPTLSGEMLEALLPHLASEEAVFTPAHLQEMIAPQSLAQAEAAMVDHDKTAGPDMLMFYLHSLTNDEQQILLGNEPWFFRKVLVGCVWRDALEGVEPYLFNQAATL